jgi:peptidyl-prolyl cis-trans isomerase SurA
MIRRFNRATSPWVRFPISEDLTMARRRLALSATLLALALAVFVGGALAQPTSPGQGGIGPPSAGQRPAAAAPARPAAPTRPATASVPLDRVVVVVNDEALTQYDVNEQKRIVLAQMQEAKVKAPAPDALEKQVIERLVTERALLQFAKDSGVRVDDQTVERTILRIAQENKLTPEEFRKLLEKERISYAKYREDIRREVTIQRLREREVENKVAVTDAELDNYLATVAVQDGGETEYKLSHILVSVPEQASPAQIDARKQRAEDALAQVKSGKEFREVAAAFSDAPDGIQGGGLGWRTPARLPTIFVETVKNMKAGDVSPVLRSPAGFHVVKLDDMRSRNAATVVEQTHAKHILIKVNEITSESDAKAKIERIKDRIDAGAKFEDQARANSEDASAGKGGDLGWISPGDTVPEFEQAMDKLKVNQLSGPVRSPFGWHLIIVDERRTQDVTQDRKREVARNAIRQRKADEQFQEFVRQVRDKAYVEYKTDER